MRARALTSLLGALGVLCASARAEAGRCVRGLGPTRIPVALNVDQGDWGTAASPCAVNEFTLTGAAQLDLERANYYGTLSAEGSVRVGFAFSERLWLSGGFTPVRYRFVQNASLAASQLEFGPLTLGLHGALLRGENWQLSPWVRLRLPLESGYRYSTTSGLEPGVAFVWGPSSRFTLHAALNAPIALSSIGVRQLTQVQLHHSLDLAWAPTTWLELVAGGELRLGFAAGNPLDYVGPKAAVRLWFGQSFLVQLAALVPLGGVERTQARVGLTLGGVWN